MVKTFTKGDIRFKRVYGKTLGRFESEYSDNTLWKLLVHHGIDVNFDYIDRDPPQLWITVARGIGLNTGIKKLKVGDNIEIRFGGNLKITGCIKSIIPGHTILLPFASTWELEDLADNISLTTKIIYEKLRDYSEVTRFYGEGPRAKAVPIKIGLDNPIIPHPDALMSVKPTFLVVELPNATEAIETQTGETETPTKAKRT